ncbi:MAG: hypothetical protein ACAI43_22750 [Phycisphaerae bacterium]
MGRVQSPPSLFEIYVLPLLGTFAVEAFQTKKNELICFFMPFLFVCVRMFLAQLKTPDWPGDAAEEAADFTRRRRAYLDLEHFAAFVLLLFEAGSVVVAGAGTPAGAWWVVGVLYVLYVVVRLGARACWINAGRVAQAWVGRAAGT